MRGCRCIPLSVSYTPLDVYKRQIYNIAIRGCFRTQDCHRYFDEYMDADRLTDEERAGVLVVFGEFDSNVLCGVCGMTNEGHITMLYVLSLIHI